MMSKPRDHDEWSEIGRLGWLPPGWWIIPSIIIGGLIWLGVYNLFF